jgi:hypothetical protein
MAWMACVAASVLAGCAGSGGSETRTVVAAAPSARIASAGSPDRVAYREITAASALLTAQARSILAGGRLPSGTALERGRARLERIRPRSRTLVSLRGALAEAIDNLLGDQTPPGARAAMKSTLAIDMDLQRWATLTQLW